MPLPYDITVREDADGVLVSIGDLRERPIPATIATAVGFLVDWRRGRLPSTLPVTVGGIALRAAKYCDVVTDILVDASGGHSKDIDPFFAAAMVRTIRAEVGPTVGIGIAGGLCAETLPTVAALVVDHDLSIDAEGRLRNDRDELDLDKARAYLNAAAAMWGWV